MATQRREVQNYLEMLKMSGVDFVPSSPLDEKGVTDASDQVLDQKQTLIQLRNEVSQCTQCSELASTRKSVVFGSVNAIRQSQ